MIPRQTCVLILACALATETGCWFKRTPKAPPAPQQPQPQAQAPAPTPPPPKPKPLEVPVVPQMPPSQEEPQVIRPKLGQIEPPKPEPKPKKRQAPAPKPVEAQAKPEAPPEALKPADPKTAEAATEPKLGEVLPEEQRRVYQFTIEENLNAARRSLNGVQGRRLTREQSETAGRVRSFIRQAEDVKHTDLSAAVQFSRRAALLANDLLESLK